ncbi:MAG: hypothetical protein IKT50_04925 [Clostridia bacterium]|nr:hypothetical protein [Clostridia bacterium]
METKQRWKNIKKRYRRYETLFYVFLGVFFLAVALELFLFGEEGRILWQKTQTFPVFYRLFSLEAVLFLGTFLLGITVYSAAFSFVSLAARGFFSAYILSSAFFFESAVDVFLFLLVLFYLLLTAWLYASYSAFAGSVSLRLFSDKCTGNSIGEEEKMFGGTLFYSTLFQNRVNLRFLSSYILIFLAYFIAVAAFTLLYAFLRSLFF